MSKPFRKKPSLAWTPHGFMTIVKLNEMLDEEYKKSFPFCTCGCGQRVSKVENVYVNGHNARKGEHSKEIRRKMSESHKGHTPWNKGLKYHIKKKVSEEVIRRRAESLKRKYEECPEIKIKIANTLKRRYASGELIGPMKGKQHSEEIKRKMSKNHWSKNPKYKDLGKQIGRKTSKIQKGKKHSEEWNRKVSESLKGKKKSKEAIEKMRKSLIEGYASGRIKPTNNSLQMKKVWQNPEFRKRISLSHKKRWNDAEFRAKMSIKHRVLFRDVEWKNEQLRKMAKGREKRPTSIERYLDRIINKYNLPFEYCGDGSIWIDGKNPDFIRNDHKQRQIIEVFGNYWHKLSDVEETIIHYKEHGGFETLIIWGSEFREDNYEQKILNKVLMFAELRDVKVIANV